MKVLLLGDRFITNEILEKEFVDIFKTYDNQIEFIYHSDNWPVEPVERNDEVSEYCGDDNLIVPLIKDVDLLITHTGCITKKVIYAASKLKAIGACRGGPVNINAEACNQKGIPIIFSPGRNSGAVAEFTIGMILNITRNIVKCHDSFINGKRWRGDLYEYSSIGNELSESTVGLIGYGAIGSKVDKILNSFGSRVIVYDPYVSEELKSTTTAEFLDFDSVLRNSDIISLHARYNKETYKMIGVEEIKKMKKGAFIINSARGELIDHTALYEALEVKKLAGAALDVFEAEPPDNSSKLFELDNIVATTHLAGASKQAAIIGARNAIQGVYDFINNRTPKYCYNNKL